MRFQTESAGRLGHMTSADRGSLASRLQTDLGPQYEVMGELGQGGSAIVYLVRDRRQHCFLAVKVMRPELMVSAAVVERFRREVRFAARLSHPNIIPVSFAKDRGELVYYSMPRARGKSLDKVLERQTRLPVETTIRILDQVAEGLAHAHRHGVIHRDIKPSNIMLEPDGTVLILDFGVAKGLSKDDGMLTASGQLLGSPEYMSPEQARNDRSVDGRTDIYSWGIVAYEMLAGRPPFMGQSVPEVLHKHLSEEPPDLGALRPEVSRNLRAVIHRCLAKQPEERWPNIRAAAWQLREAG